jgi:hypothetical protein
MGIRCLGYKNLTYYILTKLRFTIKYWSLYVERNLVNKLQSEIKICQHNGYIFQDLLNE